MRAREYVPTRAGENVAIDAVQDGSSFSVRGEGIDIRFAVEGLALPAEADASFAVWGLLPQAMQEGINLCFSCPIDPAVVANAERLSQIWEMWLPGLYRSIGITGKGEWSRPERKRLPHIYLYSGGVDSTYALLNATHATPGFAATVCVDKIDDNNMPALIAKTEPILKTLDYTRIVIRNNIRTKPVGITHAFSLAASLFFLSDVFAGGTIAADSTYASEFAIWPWGNNHFTNSFFAGSDFAVRTIGSEAGRTEKIDAIAKAGIEVGHLSFCREENAIPDNCGLCDKCVTTKAMFLIATGDIPQIFLDNSFDERRLIKLLDRRTERADVFNMYFYAKRHGVLDRIGSLADLVEEGRSRARRRGVFGSG
ncbi:MAG: hypothetical protein AB7G54_03825 [Methyloceanibacter sp.]